MASSLFLRVRRTPGVNSFPRRSTWVRVGVWTVALSGLVLYGPARSAMGAFAVSLMLLHLGLGLVLGVGALATCLLRFRIARAPLTVALAFCVGSAVVIVGRAAGGGPLRGGSPLLAIHIGAGLAALALGGAFVMGPRAASFAPPRSLLLPLLLPAGMAALSAYRYEPEAYYRSLTATNAAQAGNPLFPAGTMLTDERPWTDRHAAYCGAAGCHESEYREWLTSAHAAAGGDPFYQASWRSYAARTGLPAARWCAGCHEPTSLLGPPERHRGVDCLACHAVARVPDLMGNGRLVLAAPSEYPFAERREPALRWLHGFLLRLRPAPHRSAFLKPELHSTAEFCSSCHRMAFNVPQNHYKFLRGMDEYGAWQDSPVSGQAIHGFHLASQPRTCADCHMSREGDPPGGRSHRFLGGNTALPALRGDRVPLAATERFLRGGAVSVDLFALRRALPGRPHQEELRAPLEDASDPLRPGENVVVDIVVRNRGVGHDFPAGSGDLRDVWLAVTLTDASGRRLLASGLLDRDGAVDAEAHAYRLIALDRAGRPIERNNLDEMVTVVTPFSPRTIPAGESDLARYRFTVPRIVGRLRLTAQLLHRSVNPVFARWALPEFRETTRGGPSVETAAEKAQSPPPRTDPGVGEGRLCAFDAAVSTDGPPQFPAARSQARSRPPAAALRRPRG